MQEINIRERIKLVLICGLVYFLMDLPVQMTGILPSYAGIKNFLPFTLGLFFGIYGTAGCLLSSLIVSHSLYECICILIAGLGMFYGWHFLSRSNSVSFKTFKDYVRYILLLSLLSGLCLNANVAFTYFITGLFIAMPVNILFSSVFCIEPVMPSWCRYEYDCDFCLMAGAESLEGANEVLENSAYKYGIEMKRVLEIQSCLEELLIRILNALPDANVHVMIQFGEAISARLIYAGKKYNPFMIAKEEDEIDIMSLKIIKHRALRASFSYRYGNNYVHAVI
ncbi:MAG: hypothetical protein IJP97_00625 [Synergistaceae bacterium]|nr:hypothetical protein [Synergistaceae bacterium]